MYYPNKTHELESIVECFILELSPENKNQNKLPYISAKSQLYQRHIPKLLERELVYKLIGYLDFSSRKKTLVKSIRLGWLL